jgi:hypothetical protein
VRLEVARPARLQPAARGLLVHPPLGGNGRQQAPGVLRKGIAPGQHHVDHAVHQVLAQHGGAGHVRVRVQRNGLALREPVHQRQRLVRAAPLRRPGALVMRDHQRHAGRERGVAGLVHGLHDVLHLAAQVGGVHAAVAGHHARQRGHLVGRCRMRLVVEQPGREAVRPGGQAFFQQPRHVLALAGTRRARQVAHGRKAKRGVPHQRRHVHRRLRRPHRIAVRPHRGVAERLHPQQPKRRGRLRRHVRRQRDAAVAGQHRGDALRQLGQAIRVMQHDGIVVRVRIDEAGRNGLAAAVHHAQLGGVISTGQSPAQARSHRHDAVAGHQHVAGPRRAARAVDHQATLQQQRGLSHAALPCRHPSSAAGACERQCRGAAVRRARRAGAAPRPRPGAAPPAR